MSPAFFIQSIGMVPLFASRAFLPAFLLAFTLAYPSLMPFLSVPEVTSESFITNPLVVWTLFALALLEIAADKNTDIKNFFLSVEPYAKTLIYVLTTTQIVDEASITVLKSVHRAGFFGEYAGTLLFGLLVFSLTWLKIQIEEFLLSIDEDGDLYLHGIVSSFQDVFAFFGFFLLLFFGVFAVVAFGIMVLILFLVRKKIAAAEEKQKAACRICGHKNPPFALTCVNCRANQEPVFQIGFFGQKKEIEVRDKKKHAYLLLTHKRCPECGNRLDGLKKCGHCKTQILPDAEARRKYLSETEKRFMPVLIFSFLAGFVPVLGIAVSMIYANLYLNAPLKRYIPKSKGFVVKVLIRLSVFFVLFFGSVVGFVLAPFYVALRFALWRNAFLKTIN